MEYRKEVTKEFTKPTAVTLGKFDGIHLGHRLLIQEVIAAEKSGMISCVFSSVAFNIINNILYYIVLVVNIFLTISVNIL